MKKLIITLSVPDDFDENQIVIQTEAIPLTVEVPAEPMPTKLSEFELEIGDIQIVDGNT